MHSVWLSQKLLVRNEHLIYNSIKSHFGRQILRDLLFFLLWQNQVHLLLHFNKSNYLLSSIALTFLIYILEIGIAEQWYNFDSLTELHQLAVHNILIESMIGCDWINVVLRTMYVIEIRAAWFFFNLNCNDGKQHKLKWILIESTHYFPEHLAEQ